MNQNGLRYVFVTKANNLIDYLTARDLSKELSATDEK